MHKLPLSLFLLAALTACNSSSADCTQATTNAESVACTTQAFLDTLSFPKAAKAQYDWDDSTSKTLWSNLPTTMVERAGLRMEDMSDESREAANAIAEAVLSDAGYEDYIGIRAADEYLSTLGAAASGDYADGFYFVAVFGEPDVTGDWELMIGGHHMAFNLTYHDGVAYPTPYHMAAEPKSAFTLDGTDYAPVEPEGQAFVELFSALDSSQRSDAFMGTVMADILLGPDEYGGGGGYGVAGRAGVWDGEFHCAVC